MKILCWLLRAPNKSPFGIYLWNETLTHKLLFLRNPNNKMMVCFFTYILTKCLISLLLLLVDAILPENLDEVDQEVPPQLLFVHQVIIFNLFQKKIKIKIIFFKKIN